MTNKLSVSLGQMDVKLGRPVENLAKVEEMVIRASQSGADLLLLPELWSTGYDLENAEKHASSTDSGIFTAVADLARQHQIAILGSTLSLNDDGSFANTAVFFDENGMLLDAYNKIHLFGLMDEPIYLAPGENPVVVNTKWGPAGLAICYDLRFPELFRSYALQGAVMAFMPAEWPWPRLAHWRTLIRARAIENQMFVFACNRVGTSKDATFFGHSMAVDPSGEILAEYGEEEELLTVTVDLQQVEAVRRFMPVIEDRRPSIYGHDL